MTGRPIALWSLCGTIPVLGGVVVGIFPERVPTWATAAGEALMTPGFLALLTIKAASAHSWQTFQLVCMNILIYYAATLMALALVRWVAKRRWKHLALWLLPLAVSFCLLSCGGREQRLVEAAYRGDTPAVIQTINLGVDVNAPACVEGRGQSYAMTALMWATAGGHPDTVRALLKHGADCEVRDRRGRTALDIAIEMGRSDLTSVLDQRLRAQGSTGE